MWSAALRLRPSVSGPASPAHLPAAQSHGYFAGAALQGPTLSRCPGGLCPPARVPPMSSLLHYPTVLLPWALAHVILAEVILMAPAGGDCEHVLAEKKTAVALRTQGSSPPGPRLPVCLLLSCS